MDLPAPQHRQAQFLDPSPILHYLKTHSCPMDFPHPRISLTYYTPAIRSKGSLQHFSQGKSKDIDRRNADEFFYPVAPTGYHDKMGQGKMRDLNVGQYGFFR